MSSFDETLSKRPGELNAYWLKPVAAYLVLALQCDRPLESASRYRLEELDEVLIGRGAALSTSREAVEGRRVLAVRVPDGRISREHARLVRAGDRWVLEDSNSKNGVIVNGSVTQRAWLSDGDLFEIGHTFFLYREEAFTGDDENRPQPDDAVPSVPVPAMLPEGLQTLVPTFERELAKLAKVARTPVPVLLEGETGTGKELIARGYHYLSGRAGPLIAVNCGALPKTLLEAELFGHKRGAFSGASEDRSGHVRSAHGGTLLLDEIAELPFPSQAAFLRVLQEREVVPVGTTRPVSVDFRLVSATHGDLAALANQGVFREDLYARLAGFKLRVPPLRSRREDLGLVIPAILRRALLDGTEPRHLRLSPDVVRAFFAYKWPHNIRELERCLTTAAALAHDRIDPEHLPQAIRSELVISTELDEAESAPVVDRPPKDEKHEELVALLREHRGNISRVAEALATSRAQVHRLMDRYGIEPEKFRQ
ncbi:sigma 54-interacting transcriptional regulator [Pendulispora brunnea]|uniref:Sigma 54-interacting transcriptional regulator n=1 Tax=Pendulispora brunnea TaxID=2905690 RepID=A0ABZ2KG71_9BACT